MRLIHHLALITLSFKGCVFVGFCSRNVRLSYLYGKRVVLMLKEVESLSSHCEFTVVTETTSRPKVDEMPVQPTIVGQELMLEGYGQISWNKESILWLCIARVE
ncbi:hypothetical protein Bca4012_097721 [Brassica carinata]|uniref:(rape) hypothetical protein n=1 Tax=Brassica napus TaxID=3708 RepID=A0A816PX14_BRANA|nr:unnamed protein product [Brassica napus]